MPDAYHFEPATAASEGAVRRLLRENPVSGDIEVSLEREPNALYAAAVSGDERQLILAYSGSDPESVGVGARFELDAWINGVPRRVGYLSELRSAGGFRFRRSLLVQAYRALRRYHERGHASFYLTTIISDNTAARRLLEAGVSDMPTYRPLENLVTLVIPARAGSRARAPGLEVATGGEGDWPEISQALEKHGREFQFHPCWTEATLRSRQRCRGLSPPDFVVLRDRGAIRGCLALWDQGGFKQTVIRGYSPALRRLRPFYNLAAPLLGRPLLPPPDTRLSHAFLSHIAAGPEDADAAITLVQRACREAVVRGLDYVMAGFAERNPLCSIVSRHFPCHRYTSMIYVVYWEDGKDAAGRIDGRLPHLELAIL